jgi:hypothetical protein
MITKALVQGVGKAKCRHGRKLSIYAKIVGMLSPLLVGDTLASVRSVVSKYEQPAPG